MNHDPDFVYPPPHPRRPMVFGVLGTVLAVCCPPLGIVLGIASIAEVRKSGGGTYAWGVLPIVTSVVAGVAGAAVLLSR